MAVCGGALQPAAEGARSARTREADSQRPRANGGRHEGFERHRSGGAPRENVSRPFEQARAMPPEVYTSEAFLAAELAQVFSKEWLCLGRASALAEPGDYAAWEIAGQPVWWSATATAPSTPSPTSACTACRRSSTAAAARAHRLPLPRLDLQPRRHPARRAGDDENEAFDRKDYCLPQLRCEEWLGWIFVTLNPDAPPVAERLAEAEAADRRLRHGDLRRDLLRDPRLGHQLEGARRELHGELPPAGLPRGDHRRALEARRDGLPAGARGLQLPHDPQGRHR